MIPTKQPKPIPIASWISVLLVATVATFFIFRLVTSRDIFSGFPFNMILRSGWDVAVFKNYRLSIGEDEVFKFSTGYGSQLADVRVKMEDGRVILLSEFTPAIVETYSVERIELNSDGLDLVIYQGAFWSITFSSDQVNAFTLQEPAKVSIDFGDGTFVRLPTSFKQLKKRIGNPQRTYFQASPYP